MYGGKLTNEIIELLDEYEKKFAVMYSLIEVNFKSEEKLAGDISKHIKNGIPKVYEKIDGDI